MRSVHVILCDFFYNIIISEIVGIAKIHSTCYKKIIKKQKNIPMKLPQNCCSTLTLWLNTFITNEAIFWNSPRHTENCFVS